MTQNPHKNTLSRLHGDLFRQMQAHPYREFLVARAAQIANDAGRPEFSEDDVREALTEFHLSREQATSWANFFYAGGSAVLSVGLGLIIAALFFTTFTAIQILVAALITLLGFLLILLGVDQE